jgi:hypothetical protein
MRRTSYGKLRPNQKKLAPPHKSCGDGRLGRPAKAKPSSSRNQAQQSPLSECRRTKDEDQERRERGEEESLPQMEMRPGPATPAAFLRGFLRCLITAWRRNDRFGPTALALSQATSAAFAKASCPFAISRSRTGKPAVASGSSCSRSKSNEQVGEEAAMPGQPVALARVFWNVPPVIHPRESPGCRWLCRNHSASSGNFTFR